MFPSLPVTYISLIHSTVTVQSFTQDQEKLLGKEGSQGKGVPAIPSLKQPGFDEEIDQEENQEPCLKSGLMMFYRAGLPHWKSEKKRDVCMSGIF